MSIQASNQVSKFLPYIISTMIGAIIAVVTVVVSDAHANVSSYGSAIGSYMLMEHSNPTATPGVFRVNSNTGGVSYCYIDAGGKPSVTCTKETE